MLILLGQVKNLLFLCQNSASDGQMYAWSRKIRRRSRLRDRMSIGKREKAAEQFLLTGILCRKPDHRSQAAERGGCVPRVRAAEDAMGKNKLQDERLCFAFWKCREKCRGKRQEKFLTLSFANAIIIRRWCSGTCD